MITYEPFWNTLKKKGISTYKLIHAYQFSSSTIHKLRHNQSLTTTVLNDLCNVLECEIQDIVLHIPDKDPYRKVEHREFDF